MRLIPRTLLWRVFLLVALLQVLAVLAWSAIYRHFAVEPRARQTAQMVASVINLTRTALLTAAPSLRRELLLELSEREGIRVYPAEDDDRIAPLPDEALLQHIAAEVRRQLGTATRLSLERDEMPGLWISFAIDDDNYWMMMPRERLDQTFPAQWLGWGVAALGLSLLGAYLIVLGVTRPLKRFARAAATISSGRWPRPLPERGADEIVLVSQGFNQMLSDLQQLDHDRNLILAGISHDLRTPLTRLRLGIEISDLEASDCAAMNEDIEEMDRVIGQFLAFARHDAGEPLQTIDCNVLLQEMTDRYRRRGARVETRLAAPLPEIAARPLALRRLLTNLIDNALQHAGSEQPLELAGGITDGRLYLEVRDRGPGIPTEQCARLKRPFTRLDAARSHSSGAGLGLAIVDRIARAHGGGLDLLPNPGGGLIARVEWPLVSPTSGTG
ncbi:ATP-binding protein [Candidatus Accumulibacter vicinus]|uniref:histidine kinase n=1 Tax=Candidatus Accumulibacter vicinus TaxID=2954382 RepID=A0A084Y2X2_9PROT|nr:ATP-binding protein [Candidatus Accumulibacter vicinus]KFB69066.1 MAG: Osmolarity sensor protein EnvZ [Candidatus Accumulibacter vicinus]